MLTDLPIYPPTHLPNYLCPGQPYIRYPIHKYVGTWSTTDIDDYTQGPNHDPDPNTNSLAQPPNTNSLQPPTPPHLLKPPLLKPLLPGPSHILLQDPFPIEQLSRPADPAEAPEDIVVEA